MESESEYHARILSKAWLDGSYRREYAQALAELQGVDFNLVEDIKTEVKENGQ